MVSALGDFANVSSIEFVEIAKSMWIVFNNVCLCVLWCWLVANCQMDAQISDCLVVAPVRSMANASIRMENARMESVCVALTAFVITVKPPWCNGRMLVCFICLLCCFLACSLFFFIYFIYFYFVIFSNFFFLSFLFFVLCFFFLFSSSFFLFSSSSSFFFSFFLSFFLFFSFFFLFFFCFLLLSFFVALSLFLFLVSCMCVLIS
jgi:hypothetical protein